jgi:hypothetical protein
LIVAIEQLSSGGHRKNVAPANYCDRALDR